MLTATLDGFSPTRLSIMCYSAIRSLFADMPFIWKVSLEAQQPRDEQSHVRVDA